MAGGKMSWATAKKLKIAALTLAFMGIGFASSYWLVRILPAAREALVGANGFLAILAVIPPFDLLIERYPLNASGLVGAVVLGLPMAALFAPPLHARILASFNDDVLAPIRQKIRPERNIGGAQLVALDWQCPEEGPRREVWNELLDWVRDGSSRHPFSKSDDQEFRRFTCAVLVGRSGSGKSRMANELGRHLARRNIVGSSGEGSRWGRRTASALRRALALWGASSEDPWDAGVLIEGERENLGDLVERLQDWEPRRPTYLILDDPAPGNVGSIVSALRQTPGTAPIRLLVINQTVPDGLGLTYDLASRSWDNSKAIAARPPIRLSSNGWFDEQETISAAFGTGMFAMPATRQTMAQTDRIAGMQREIRERLYEITQGNPLLVELALEFLLEHGSLEDATSHILVKNRARLIMTALADAGLAGRIPLAMLATSTLTNGAEITLLQKHGSESFRSFNWPIGSVMSHLFPTQAARMDQSLEELPAVRPDLIADAFCEAALEEMDPGLRAEVVRTAFRVAPREMLRQAARRKGGALLSQAFAELDIWQIEGLDPVDLAMAFVEAAVFIPLPAPGWSEAGQRRAVDLAMAAIEKLDKGQQRDFADRLVTLAELEPTQPYDRQYIPHLVLVIAERIAAFDAEIIAPQNWLRLLKSFERSGDKEWRSTEYVPSTSLDALRNLASREVDTANAIADGIMEAATALRRLLKPWLIAMLPERTLTVAPQEAGEFLVQFGADTNKRQPRGPLPHRFELMDSALGASIDRFESILDRDLIDTLELLEANRLAAFAHASLPGGKGLAKCKEIAERAQTNLSPDIVSADSDLLLAKTWQSVSYAAHIGTLAELMDAGRQSVEEVGKIATRHSSHPNFARIKVGALANLVHGTCNRKTAESLGVARNAMDQIRQVESEFPHDWQVRMSAAGARRALAYIETDETFLPDAAAAQAVAEEAGEWANAFPQDVAVQEAALCAWRHTTWGYAQKLIDDWQAGLWRAALKASEISDRFPQNPDVASETAYAWQHVAHGLARIDRRRCRLAAERAERTTLGRSRIDYIDQKAIQAWRRVTFDLSAAPSKLDAEQIAKIARKCTVVAASYPADQPINFEIAVMWTNLAFAGSVQERGWGWGLCLEAWHGMAAIAAVFPDDPAIQLQAARTLRNVSYAFCILPEGSGVEQSSAFTAMAASISESFPANRELLHEKAQALRFTAFAHSRLPEGRGAEDTVALARTILSLAPVKDGEHSETDEKIVFEGMVALRHCIDSWLQQSDAAGRTAAWSSAASAKSYADLVPDSERCNEEAAKGLKYLVRKGPSDDPTQVLQSASWLGASLQELSRRFPENETVLSALGAAQTWYVELTTSKPSRTN